MSNMNLMITSVIASLLISLVSLVGILGFKLRKNLLRKELMTLVGLAAGALLGDAFLHLLPESLELNGARISGLMIIGGMLIFFALEKFLKWRHCHNTECRPEHKIATMSLAADGIHNLIDGMVIGGSFMSSIQLGVTTSIAILLHEIPQEIGDLAILIHSGLPLKKAALFNLLSGLLSLLGVIIVWTLGQGKWQEFLIPITAGGFIYLAASDLIPEMHRHENKIKESLWQLITVVLGVGLLFLI